MCISISSVYIFIRICVCVYIYIYTYGWHYPSHATCLIQASFVLCVFRRVKDHRKLLHYSPLLKKARVRQVVLDK